LKQATRGAMKKICTICEEHLLCCEKSCLIIQ
jgi:hypothetical protein